MPGVTIQLAIQTTPFCHVTTTENAITRTFLYLGFYTELNFKANWFSPVFTLCHYPDILKRSNPPTHDVQRTKISPIYLSPTLKHCYCFKMETPWKHGGAPTSDASPAGATQHLNQSHGAAEYPELEGTHQDHRVPLQAPLRTAQLPARV